MSNAAPRTSKQPELPTPPPVSAREHWRAGPFIRRAKGIGGLGGFALVSLAGVMHGAALQDLLWHGLVGGFVGWFVAWGVALAVWRQLIPAETRHLVDEIIEARRRTLEKEQARRAALEAAQAAAAAEAEAAAPWSAD